MARWHCTMVAKASWKGITVDAESVAEAVETAPTECPGFLAAHVHQAVEPGEYVYRPKGRMFAPIAPQSHSSGVTS